MCQIGGLGKLARRPVLYWRRIFRAGGMREAAANLDRETIGSKYALWGLYAGGNGGQGRGDLFGADRPIGRAGVNREVCCH